MLRNSGQRPQKDGNTRTEICTCVLRLLSLTVTVDHDLLNRVRSPAATRTPNTVVRDPKRPFFHAVTIMAPPFGFATPLCANVLETLTPFELV
jgi:hypothetical protein